MKDNSRMKIRIILYALSSAIFLNSFWLLNSLLKNIYTIFNPPH
ncbi:hypothetical protein ENTCAN_05124 [Enterobacter cancerogenus ATCC 35316]|nr:hypothetical protein ENTCAN_05124 [Enterobacter cancerogenus ATCC 35316]